MAAKDFDWPDDQAVIDEQGNITPAWLQAFSRWHDLVITLQASGPTTERPTSMLWVGRQYFDTTLGYMINLKSTGPDVWVDGVGTAV